jgi:ABC-type transport system involved in multi-copper enzyme maturation permease subunit
MVKEVILKELRENFRTIRFYLIFVLVVVLFICSSIIFIQRYDHKLLDYNNDISENDENLNEKSQSLYNLARHRQSLNKKPNPYEFISEANERLLPNKFESNIFYLDFPEVKGRGNVLLRGFKNVDWEFIIAVVLSFLAFVVSYDSVCGEKEEKTLSLVFSNSVKTVSIFLGKFFGLLISLAIPLFIGMLIGLILIYLNGFSQLDLGRIFLFVFISLVYLSLFLLIGLVVSSLYSQSITSAITLLFVWVIAAFVIPASGSLLASQLYPIQTQAQIEESIERAQDAIYDTKYRGTEAGNWDGNAFAPHVPLRAQWMEDIMHSRNRIYDDYIHRMVDQVEKTKSITRISPVSVFRYLAEEISGTGVRRFENFYEQADQYKQSLYEFIEIKDRPDPESPHFLPLVLGINAGISRLPVEFSSVPRFEEKLPSLGENFKLIILDLAILFCLCIAFFYIGFVLFVKYDKR